MTTEAKLNRAYELRVEAARKAYLDDPEKPHGYLVSVSGWFPGDTLIN